MADDALADIAGELHALPPDEFVAARNALAGELRQGDRALADAVAELRRPSPAAWLVNQLVRHRGDEVERLLELGEQLRAAQRDLDASSLTALARERRAVVAALCRDAGQLAEELGRPVRAPVLDEVAETLQAAMTDASAADAVRTGRLVRGLEAVGTEVDVAGAVAGGAPAVRHAERPNSADTGDPDAGDTGARDAAGIRADRTAQELAEAVDAASAAELSARQASERLEAARAVEARAADAVAEIERLLGELEQRRSAAAHELAEARRALRPLERDHDRAARAAERSRATADALRGEDGRRR